MSFNVIVHEERQWININIQKRHDLLFCNIYISLAYGLDKFVNIYLVVI